MSKRPRRGKLSGPSEQSQISSKKARTDGSCPKSESELTSLTDEEEKDTLVAPVPAPPPAETRDSEYYYEDGSVILLVEDVLFKVHGSLLKAQSEVFRDMLTSPSGGSDAKLEGLTDDRPIEVPEITAREFRYLLMVFYSLDPSPSHKLFLGARGIKEPARARESFDILSNVARLADKFCMADIEKWAVGQLKSLLETSTTRVATGAKAELENEHPLIFHLALQYAIARSDTSLIYSTRILNQYYYTLPPHVSTANLFYFLGKFQEEDPSLFGFLFITILNLGQEGWQQECFTKDERIIFFAAHYRLTPLPESLGKDLKLPLLVKPSYTKAGYLKEFGDENCAGNCQQRLSTAWKASFNSNYYHDVTSSESMKPTTQLGRLPILRFEFANAIRANSACKNGCNIKALATLDVNISALFKRLADYYREVN
ncbi:hypothetical protein FRC12_020920 [Ceratobasidium sp. 428]|nr:hypothetical protein FRC12_020920 [Ceratobasidium sp. 428]